MARWTSGALDSVVIMKTGVSGRKVLGEALLEELKSVHAGHVDIRDDELEGRLSAQELEGFGAVAGLEDLRELDAGLPQGSLHDFAHDR